MAVEVKQKIGRDIYIEFETGKLKYNISPFTTLADKYVYATANIADSFDLFVVQGDYSVSFEEGNYYINFVAGYPVDDFHAFKIVEVKDEFDRVTTITELADINPTNLNAEFDHIEEYVSLLQETMSNKALRYDAPYDDTMLPQLGAGQFWIKTEVGFRASNFETIEALIGEAFNDFFGIIGGEDLTFTFEGVTAIGGDFFLTDIIGAVVDGIAVQKGDSFGTYYVLTSGFVIIPEGEVDEIGNAFVTDAYYYQSLTQAGKFSLVEPVSGIKKLVFKVIEGLSQGETVQYALILNYPHTIGNGQQVSEFVRYYDIQANMVADLTLGLNQRVDVGANHYKITATVQPILLDNGLYAGILISTQVGTNQTDILTKQNILNKNTIVTTDFDNYVDEGNYYVARPDITVLANYPRSTLGVSAYGYGNLNVKKYFGTSTTNDDYVIQTYYPDSNEGVYVRQTFTSAWKPWSKLISDKVTILPVGTITMYSGDGNNLGANWKLCDGTNGTPNLVGRFIRGGSIAQINNTGGSDDAVVVAHIHGQPAHTHTMLSGGHSEAFSGNRVAGGDGQFTSTRTTNSGGGDNVYSTGVSGTGKNIPVYYTLAYIMKIQ